MTVGARGGYGSRVSLYVSMRKPWGASGEMVGSVFRSEGGVYRSNKKENHHSKYVIVRHRTT